MVSRRDRGNEPTRKKSQDPSGHPAPNDAAGIVNHAHAMSNKRDQRRDRVASSSPSLHRTQLPRTDTTMSSSNLKPSQSKENLKQKSLMSFFSKGPQTPATPAVKRRLQDTSSDAPPSSSPLNLTPNPRKASSSSMMSATFTGSSDGKSHRTGSPPPSSDAVDVDMLSDEEEQPKKVRSSYPHPLISRTIGFCVAADQTKDLRERLIRQ